MGRPYGAYLMYFLTHITFQGVFLVTLVTVTFLGMWWSER
jgi:hypothetical protein